MTVDTRYFVLGIRIVGIFVLARAVPDTVYQLLGFAQIFSTRSAPFTDWEEAAWAWAPTLVYQIVELWIGTYLLMGGGILARWCIRSCEYNCPRCGYDLKAVKADRCPECGSKNVLLAHAPPRAEAGPVH